MGGAGTQGATSASEPVARVPSSAGWHVSWLDLAGLLVSCLVVVVAFSPVIFGGRTLSTATKAPGTNGYAPFPGQPEPDYSSELRVDPWAQPLQFEPWAEVVHRAYAKGELPLWNPYQGAGAPLAANMQSAAFDPLLAAVYLNPSPLTWDLSILGAFIFGAAAAYLLGRVLGLHVIPAVVASAAFSLSGWFFLFSNNHFSRSYVFLPLLFLLVELTLRYRRWWLVLVLSVAIAENIYIGMPEASFFVIGAAAVYAAIRIVQERSTMPMRTSLARLGGASLLGLLLAAPLLLLFLEYESLSFNIHKPELSKGTGADPAVGILHWIRPFFPGAPEAPYPMGYPKNWFGVAVGIAALVAVSGREETKRLHAWLFFVLGLGVLAKIYGFGLVNWLGGLPVANLVIFPIFASPVVSFTFAMLAGIGVQVLWNGELRLRRFSTLLASALSVFVAIVLTGDRSRVIDNEFAPAVWSRRALLAVLVVAVVVLASRAARRMGACLVAGLIVVELFRLAPFGFYAERADPFLTPGWMPLVRTALASEPDARVFGIDGKLYPNTAAALGLQDIRAVDALHVERYWRYVQAFIEPEAQPGLFTGEAPRPRLQENPMFDMLGVRAVLSKRDLGTEPALRLLGRDRDTRVYENTSAYPRAWVVHDIDVVRDEDEAFAFLEGHARRQDGAFIVDSFDPRREAVVEDDGKTPDDTLRGLSSGRQVCTKGRHDRATIERYSGNTVSLRVEAACPGLLVLSDTYYPGWKATVNGRDRTIYPTNGTFRGVTVPEGISDVEFRYEPRALALGVVLAVSGLMSFTAIWLASAWRNRNRRSPTTTAKIPSEQRSLS